MHEPDLIYHATKEIPPRKAIFLFALLSGFALGISRHVLPVIYPSMSLSLGIGYTELGILTSVYFFTYTILSFAAGHLSDRMGSIPIVVLGCIVTGTGVLSIGFCNSFGFLFLYSVIIGIGASALYVPALSSIMKSATESKAFSVSMVLVGEGLLGIIAGVAIPYVTTFYSWRHSWWLFGVLLLLFALLIWFVMMQKQISIEQLDKGKEGSVFSLRELRSEKVFTLGFIYFLHAITRGIFVTFAVSFLVQKGIDYGTASNAFSLLALGIIPGAILTGVLSDRLNLKYFLACLLIIQAACISMMIISDNLVLGFVLFVILGFCVTGVPTIMGVIPSRYCGDEIYGRVLGFLTSMLGLGIAVSPIIGGCIGDLTSSLAFSFLVGILASLIAAGFAILKL